jgi:hypothetical protein
MNTAALDKFIKEKFNKSGSLVAARLQTALALLERLRELPNLQLAQHLSEAGQSLISHETYGDNAHKRLSLEKINKNHGRRSSSIRDWGQGLLDLLKEEQFERLNDKRRASLLDCAQERMAEHLRGILNLEPLTVRVKGRSAEAVIAEALAQAESKGRMAMVAQYLVGAKLQLRFPSKLDLIKVLPANKGDRKSRSDEQQRRGDFDLGEYVIEVTVAPPDAKHMDQVATILEDADAEVWLLVRGDRLQFWKAEIEGAELDQRRVVVASIELFVGQNVTELGDLSAKGKAEQLDKLFRIYNEVWVAKLGSPGIRIVIK